MEQDRGTEQHQQKKVSFGQRWSEARPTKTLVFWSWVASVVLTMLIGFAWGGWVKGSTAQKMVADAVVNRLAPMCVARFNQDPGKDQKLKELKETGYWQRTEYIQKQGWATMSGEEKPDQSVAEACAKLLMEIPQNTPVPPVEKTSPLK
jgi:hypothetical protein